MRALNKYIDICLALVLAAWQTVVLPSCIHHWIAGQRTSAVVDYLFPTSQLIAALAYAAHARGRSRWWCLSAVVAPIGVAVVYRWPLRVLPLIPPGPPPRPPSPAVPIIGGIAQGIVVWTAALEYPWSRRYEWAGYLLIWLVIAAPMSIALARTLADRGHATAWAALTLLGPIGLIVLHCLPYRPMDPRGFPLNALESPDEDSRSRNASAESA